MTEDFMSLTLDLWSIPPERARRVGHPAPFPVELPEQLIRLYTFEDDLVLDPFMGSGSALVAAAKLGRRYVGYDLDDSYVTIARHRVKEVLETGVADGADRRAAHDGKAADKVAEQVLLDAGFEITGRDRRVPKTGVAVSFVAIDGAGDTWLFDVCGAFTSYRGGLQRTDAVWRSLGRANALKGRVGDETPIVFLTTNLPRPSTEGDTALRAAGPTAFFDAIDLLCDDDRRRLQTYAKGGHRAGPQPGFWTAADLAGAR
jgi:site-specific DNA-methyltransferase (adenine-specific)